LLFRDREGFDDNEIQHPITAIEEDSLVMDMDMEAAMFFTSTSSRKKEWFTHGATTRYHSLADLPKKATSKMK